MLAPLLFLLSVPDLLHRPSRWLVVWFLVASGCMFNLSTGGPLFLASIPVVLSMANKLRTQSPARLHKLLGIVILLAFGGALLPTTRDILIGFFIYIRQTVGNLPLAQGIPWAQSMSILPDGKWGAAQTSLSWILIRFAWAGVLLLTIRILWNEIAQDPRERRIPRIVLCWLLTATCLGMVPWTMSRIDTGVPSRAGWLSYFLVGLIIPLLIVARGHAYGRCCRTLAFSFAIPFFHPDPDWGSSPSPLLRRSFLTHQVPHGNALVDGLNMGFRTWGAFSTMTTGRSPCAPRRTD